ncbi:hypothetical protein HG444_002050 [Candidatus Saccharibacteria bacterium]|nr:hypothetical protein [Candidatus Saccharibacteria bacterium]
MMDIITSANESTLTLAALLSISVSVGLFVGYMWFKTHAKDTLRVVAAAIILSIYYVAVIIFFKILMEVGIQFQSPWVAFSVYAAHLIGIFSLSATITLTIFIVKEWPHSRSVRYALEIDV